MPPVPRTEGPDSDGFYTTFFDDSGFNGIFGPIHSRAEGNVARVRIETGLARGNPMGALHGGFLLAFLDQAVFVGGVVLGRLGLPNWAVTLGFSTQFVAPGRVDVPLDCMVEIVSETGKLMFQRGQLEQEGRALLIFQATLRKVRFGS